MGQGVPDEESPRSRGVRVAEIVAAVLESPRARREAKIESLCAQDADLEREVRSLLQHQSILDDPDHPLSDNAIDALADVYRARRGGGGESVSQADLEGVRVAGYHIRRVLGEGGMGVVYEAEQANPRRRVALKIIDALRGVPSAHKRLEIEAEILGMLYHPGIAQVYEAGSAYTSVGGAPRPFFAMELVEGGVPITAYAEQCNLDTRARLALIASVADAVDHAHKRGVIHRDLKPDNVLVTPEGRPKVLDFGIARIASDSTLAATTMTREGQILGTLAYMAPEQLAGDPTKVGASADVYALGVIAFELLAGRLPLNLGGLSISAAVRVVEFEAPPRLGTIDRALRGDVETIVECCLRREAGRRYESAAALAADILRYLNSRPILARKPTFRYKTSRYIKRNKIGVTAAVVVMVAIISGVLIASLFAMDRQRARITAENERVNARLREVDSIRGVLTSAALLHERGKPWEAVRQMLTVPRASRNWEWRHHALAYPWTIETGPERTALPSVQPEAYTGFVGNETIFAYSLGSSNAWVHEVIADRTRPIPLGGMGLEVARPWQSPAPEKVSVGLMDQRIGALDTSTGRFTPWAFTMPVADPSRVRKFFPAPDPDTIVSWEGSRLAIHVNNTEVFSLDSGTGDPIGMNWNPPVFSPDARWIYLASWGQGGEIITVDANTWTEHARVPSRAFGPVLMLSDDGSRVYSVTVDSGLEVFTAPDLLPLDPIDPELGWSAALARSPTGSTYAAMYVDEQIMRVYDAESDTPLFDLPRGTAEGGDTLSYAPDGRLVMAETPELRYVWLVDTQAPHAPQVTHLRGHASWIYQLAVSPDGSLLASAAPRGDILLWDLTADRLLARIPRRHASDAATLAHNMNGAVVFDPSGEHLLFCELQQDPISYGVTHIKLATGERTTTRLPSYNAALDLLAREIASSAPARLFHHAALLGNGRIVQSTAAGLGDDSLVVRPIGGAKEGDKLLIHTRARFHTGVAPHPEGHVYVSGEYLIARVRDAATDEVLFEIAEGIRLPSYALAYSPDGSRLAMGTEDGRVLIFETEFYRKIADIQLPDTLPGTDRNYAYNIAWTPDGSRLITCADTEIRILESERPLARDRKRSDWQAQLDRARASLIDSSSTPVSGPALRVARIEAWAGEPTERTYPESDGATP